MVEKSVILEVTVQMTGIQLQELVPAVLEKEQNIVILLVYESVRYNILIPVLILVRIITVEMVLLTQTYEKHVMMEILSNEIDVHQHVLLNPVEMDIKMQMDQITFGEMQMTSTVMVSHDVMHSVSMKDVEME